MVASMIRATTEAGETMRRRLGVLLAKERDKISKFSSISFSRPRIPFPGSAGKVRPEPYLLATRNTARRSCPNCHCQIARLGSLARRAAVDARSQQAWSVPSCKSSGQLRPIFKTPIHSCACVCVSLHALALHTLLFLPLHGPATPVVPLPLILITTTQLPVDIPTEFQHPTFLSQSLNTLCPQAPAIPRPIPQTSAISG